MGRFVVPFRQTINGLLVAGFNSDFLASVLQSSVDVII